MRAQSGQTALILAACTGHVDCVRLLLDSGADVGYKATVRAHSVASSEVLSEKTRLCKTSEEWTKMKI